MKHYYEFLKVLDSRLDAYFKDQAEFICCKKGCSACCEKGDYPISELELHYVMQGFQVLDNEMKSIVQKNFKNIKKGEQCPFLINSCCSIYNYRPIICRVHGLAYVCKNKMVKVPYCVNENLNYSKVYKDGILNTEPITENLNTQNLLKGIEFGEIRDLYDWIVSKN